LRFETAEISLLGDREDNQDRLAVHEAEAGLLLVVADGMGGHAGGAAAASTAVGSLVRSFECAGAHVDPAGFLAQAIARAHDEVVALGARVGIGAAPRTTIAVCLVRDGQAVWAHVGDSRVYHGRGGSLATRTRDHTAIEALLRDGLIAEDEIPGHPMRHYVEFCLGGAPEQPRVAVSEPTALAPYDLLLLCSDGLWSGVGDDELGAGPGDEAALGDWLTRMAGRAVRTCAPYSDNTTAVALRVLPDGGDEGAAS
jgi:serine/threonine protein phosphatase PrpC